MPALWSVNEKRAPGATVPEFHAFVSAVDVCGTESALIQVTVVPTATSATSGLNALVVNAAAPIGIETDDEGPVGAGTGAGVGVAGDEYPLPHAIVKIRSIDTTYKRNNDIWFSTAGITAVLLIVFCAFPSALKRVMVALRTSQTLQHL